MVRKMFKHFVLMLFLLCCLFMPDFARAQSVAGIPDGIPITGNGLSGYVFSNGQGIIIGSGFGSTASLVAGFSTFAFEIAATGTGQSTTLTIGFTNPSRYGYSCFASDVTTSAKNPIWESAMSQTSVTLTPTAAPAAGDLINVSCFAF